jgi:hypothetical protein
MVAGLAFQVFTLLIFMALCIDFGLRTHRRFKAMGTSALDQSPELAQLRHSRAFRGFLAALTLATICIFWRSVYRVVELAEGWTGELIRRQNLFIGFEGVMVVMACAALNAFHPVVCFRAGVEGLGGLGSKRKAKGAEMEVRKEVKQGAPEGANGSGSNSDVEIVAH